MPLDPARRVQHRAGAMAWCAWGIVAVALLTLPFACAVREAGAAPPAAAPAYRFSPAACAQLAELVGMSARARDQGVREPALVAIVGHFLGVYGMPAGLSKLILAEVRRVYASARAPAQLELDLHTRCVTGPLGGETT